MNPFFKKIVLFFLVSVSIFGYGKSDSVRTLKVGVYDNPPKIFVNHSNEPDGIFIDILKEIAKQEHFNIQYVYGDWFEIMEQLQEGTIDMVPDVAYSDERDSLFTFHNLYIINSWLEVFTMKENNIYTMEDLNNKKVGVLKGSIQEEYINNSLKSIYNVNYNIILYNDYSESIDALLNHEVDLIIANRFLYYTQIFDQKIIPTGIILKPSDLFFAFRKNIDLEIVTQFDKQIALMKNDPKSIFFKSLHKWLDKDYKTTIPSYMIWLFSFAILIGIIIVIFIFILRQQIKEKTLELKLINQELLFSKIKAEESDQLKTAFLHNISHEIRTPLNVICGFSNLLNDPNIESSTIKEYTDMIQRNSDQLLHVLTDIITIASIETNQEIINYSHFNLYTLMLEIKNIFIKNAYNKKLQLVFTPLLSEKKSEIIGDRSKIIQIIHHLIHNAIKFTNQGEIKFGYRMSDHEVEFFVSDTGIGISEEQQEKIFDRFTHANYSVQTNYGGTGLGLPISKGLVNLLGGKIWVVSKLGVGSTFYFTIPKNKT